ncbi:hypothetical protein Bca52824_044796 [Brassica carinata]|uniref:Uncharacterized protein n=1 Tax=Brassica carinata TaxID=52824 RepID=A0A8X7RCK0_BRACI|nr:hypothetical protein Bca52824_044796 [Brassica carinata]
MVVAPIPGASTPTPPNPSDSTPSGSMTPRDSELLHNSTLPIQSNTSPSSLAHPTQPGEDSNPVHLPNPFSTSSESQSNSNSLLPVFQRPSESTSRVPWYHGNSFYAAERASHGIPPNEYHLMDHLSSYVIQYVFGWGINFSSQRPNPNINIYSQAFLNQGALSLFLLANAVFPRTHPVLAFYLDRLSFLLIVISTYLASLYMFPPYVAIIPILALTLGYLLLAIMVLVVTN